MTVRTCRLADRDQVRDVGVQRGQGLVERGEAGGAAARQLSEVGVGNLPVADDPGRPDVGIGDVVGPELVPRVGGHIGDDRAGRLGALAFAYQQPHQAALGDRAGGEATCPAGEPGLGRRVVDVIVYQQGNQHVRVE